MTSQTELHNLLVGRIVASIIGPPMDAGGEPTDALVLLESVVIGAILFVTKRGHEEEVLDTMVENVKARIADARLRMTETAGNA